MSEKLFDAYSDYYDLIYRDKDYVSESQYIQGVLTRNGLIKGQILEFGSGTGRHGGLLAKAGYTVHGIELSPEMVALATPVEGFSCQVGDISNTRIEKKYDAVVSLFHVISYLTSNRQLQDVFENAFAHLDSGGLFVFDFWYTPAVYCQYPEVRVKHMRSDKIEITRFAEPKMFPNENRVDVQYTIYARDLITSMVETICETHKMRHFSLPEINFLAEANGFELLGAEEFLTGKEPSEDTWGVCVILRKIQA